MEEKIKFDADHVGYMISNIKDVLYDEYPISDTTDELDLENGKYTLTVYTSSEYAYGEPGGKTTFNINLAEVVDIIDDEETLLKYLEEHSEYINYEDLAQEYYEKAEEAIEKKYGCKNAYLEPSTQAGRGGVFLFADDMTFDGSMDFETSEEYVYDENLDGFIDMVLSSFYPYEEDDDVDDEVYDGNGNGISTEEEEG